MDFAWDDEQQHFREAVIRFAREELNDGYAEREREGKFDHDGWRKCAEMGIHGLPVPEQYGGAGRDALTTMGVLEALGYGCVDNGLLFSINAHMWTLELPVLNFGSEQQKQDWLPPLCSGELVGANAMSEPDSGSDAYSITTRARRDGDDYVLDGSKVFVSNGSVADLFLVYATVDPEKGPNGVTGFLVEADRVGVSRGAPTKKMGLKTSPMSELYLDGVRVPEANRLGREGAGKMLFADSMTWERSCILASAVGTQQRLLEDSIRYANERKQFGQAIGKFQLVASRIVDMKLRLEASRALLYQAGWKKSQGKSIFLEAALAKLQISESLVATAQDAMQVHGGYGYMVEYGIEREVRDALAARLYSGTTEIQRNLIASLLGL